MPNYKYRAINQDGKMIESVLVAPTQNYVIEQLLKLKLTPVEIKIEKEKQVLKGAKSARVDVKSILLFTKQLRTLIKAGIPIVTCLHVIKDQAPNDEFENIVATVAKDIEEGSKLSDALSKFPRAFPSIYINAIKVGEVSGTLEDALEQLARFMEEDEKIKKAVKKALRYPVIVVCAMITAFTIFVTYVIPNFIPIFEMSGTALPLPTEVLMGLYYLITDYGLYTFVILAVSLSGFIVWARTGKGRYKVDELKLKIPILGKLVQKTNIARFAKLFYTLNHTGITIVKSFEIMSETLDNLVYQNEVKKIKSFVIKGGEIASALKQSPYFTKLLATMISIGEKSGSLDEMLENVSSYYYQEVKETVDNLTASIEPVVTVILGASVLVLALALFLPMWGMMNAFR